MQIWHVGIEHTHGSAAMEVDRDIKGGTLAT